MVRLPALALAALAAAAPFAPAQEPPKAPPANSTRTEDVVYGRKYGTALTLDVLAPVGKANGLGVVYCVSGGWVSNHDFIGTPTFQALVRPLLDRGYTVFAVCHGCQPKFTIPEVLDDMHRAVRFVRHKAKDYRVDPDRLGIAGASAGGHLSLMQGNAFLKADPKAVDPVNRESSRVAAVGCFFPPTDFLNYGKEGEMALGFGTLKAFRAPFDFRAIDPNTRAFERVLDPAEVLKTARQISPAYHVTKDSAPALVIHGDADKLVPIQQAEVLAPRYKAAGVPYELVVKKGAAHGWPGIEKDVALIADWFDKHLADKK